MRSERFLSILTGALILSAVIFVYRAQAYNATDLLGHLDDTTNLPIYTVSTANDVPNGRGFSSQVMSLALDIVHHRLFVGDRVNNRVVVFNLDANNNLIDHVADNVIGASSLHVVGTGIIAQNTVNGVESLAYDANNNRLFVVSHNFNRVEVFDVSTITNGMNASYVLGQPNFTSSTAATSQSGMSFPSSLAYDSLNDRLFVGERTNNRILVFNVAPGLISTGMNATAVLGQPNFTSSTATTTQSGVSFGSDSGLWYDSTSTRLFVEDSTNHRVLIFTVTSTIVNGQPATNVLGQTNFTSSTAAISQSGLTSPIEGVTYDSTHSRLFVAQANHRISIFTVTSTVVNGQPATNVLCQPNFTSSTVATTQSGCNRPEQMAYDAQNDRLWVADFLNKRVLIFDVASITDGENAVDLLGQLDENDVPDYTRSYSDNAPGLRGFSSSHGVTVDTIHHRLFATDGGNARVLVFNLDSSNNLIDRLPDKVLGQTVFTTSTSGTTQSKLSGTLFGLTYDKTNDRLFVADTGNNRVMVYDTSSLTNGMAAAYEIGQPNFTSSTATTTQSGLRTPIGVAYDEPNGRLFVGDRDNNRVMVFNAGPSSISSGMPASYVLGQSTFTTLNTSSSQSGMNQPFELGYDSTNQRLFVPELNNNRVLIFNAAPANMANGMNAANVLGQANFGSSTAATTQSRMSLPSGAVYDSSSDQLFISDFSNDRVLIFSNASTITDGENASAVLGQTSFTSLVAAVTQSGMSSANSPEYDSGNARFYVTGAGASSRVLVFDMVKIASACPAAGDVGSSYSATLSSSGSQGTVSFAVASGTLPTGLSVSGATISGTPSASGAYTFTLQASDDNGANGIIRSPMQTCTMTVRGAAVAVGGAMAPSPSQSTPPPTPAPAPTPAPTPAPQPSTGDGSSNSGSGSSSNGISPTVPVSQYKFKRDLRLFMTGSDVKELQKYLNSVGFPVAVTGAGSLGQETTRFGALTKVALIKFQEFYKYQILIPAGVPSGKGTGFLGPFSRSVLNGQ
jgi:uncharacterized protein YjiK